MHLPRPVVVGISAPTFRLVVNDRMPVRAQRRLGDLVATMFRPPAGTQIEHLTLGGQHAERVSVGASERPRAILYLHGGGYVVGSARMYRALGGQLARSTSAVVFNLDYRLAPEHVYPAAVDDAVAAFRELVESHGYDPSRIAIAGDSAGGGLAVAAARRLIDDGLHPAALVLLSPWTDPADRDTADRDFVINKRWAVQCAELYRGDTDPADPGYAPMWAKLGDLPPMLIHFGRLELLNAQVRRFIDRAQSQGADVTAVELPTLWHSGHLEAGMLREATDAVQDIATWLHPHLNA